MQRDFKTQKYAVKGKNQHPNHLIRYLPKEPLQPAGYNTQFISFLATKKFNNYFPPLPLQWDGLRMECDKHNSVPGLFAD